MKHVTAGVNNGRKWENISKPNSLKHLKKCFTIGKFNEKDRGSYKQYFHTFHQLIHGRIIHGRIISLVAEVVGLGWRGYNWCLHYATCMQIEGLVKMWMCKGISYCILKGEP